VLARESRVVADGSAAATASETVDPVTARELTALALSVALVPLNSTMLAVALPSIGDDIAVPAAALTQWLVTGYLLVAIMLQSPAGKLADSIGHRRALTLGQAVFAGGAMLGYVSPGLTGLVVARGLLAAGGAIMVPSAMATLRTRLPPARRGQAFGAFGAVMGLAAAVGPVIGGELAARLGWRALFSVNAPPIVLAALLGLRHAGRAEPQKPFRADVVGSILLAGGLAVLVIASRAKTNAVPLALGGIIALSLFVAWERRVADPVVDLSLFLRPVFSASTMIIALQNLAMYALLMALPIVLTRAFHVGSAEVGRTLVAMTLAMVVASLAGGRIADRIGARTTAATGASVAVIGMIAAATLPLNGPRDLILPLSVLGFGLGLTTPPSQAAGLDAVPPERSGMAAGVSSTMRYLGGVVGVAIVSGLLASGDALSRYRMAAFVFTGVLVLALAVTFVLPSRLVTKRR
jgi:EmrB/QacA subfamily drug resistance transporter